MNPWHDVVAGQNAPEKVNSVIEVPKNTRAKYELDKNSGLLRFKRVIFLLCIARLIIALYQRHYVRIKIRFTSWYLVRSMLSPCVLWMPK